MALASSVVDGARSDVSGNAANAVDDRRVDGGAAFPRTARLLDGKAYDSVFRNNRRVADRYWTVLVHATASGAKARVGLAIAKKRARRAVDRNRIKRVARESFRHARHRLSGRDVVIMNRDAAAGAPARTLRISLDALWSRLLRQSPVSSSGSSSDSGVSR